MEDVWDVVHIPVYFKDQIDAVVHHDLAARTSSELKLTWAGLKQGIRLGCGLFAGLSNTV
jgi:hypothetical protein